MATTLSHLIVKIGADTSGLAAGMGRARKQADSFAGSFRRLDASVTAWSTRMTSGPMAALITGGGLALAFRGAYQAADDLDKAVRRLSATSKLTGTSLEFMEGVAGRTKEQFALSTRIANDLTVEMSKLASKAGDVGQASAAMGAFLDIGAARGLAAEETLQAVRQAILGIDEGTDKLFGANPSVLYKEYADAIGISAGALTDQQKAQALLNAAVSRGVKVQGEYAEFLDSAAGKSALAAVRTEEMAARFGQAMVPVRNLGNQMRVFGAEVLSRLITRIEIFAVKLQIAFMTFPLAMKKAMGLLLQNMAEGFRDLNAMLPKVLQFDAVEGGLDKIAQAGMRMVVEANRAAQPLLDTYRTMRDEILETAGAAGGPAADAMDVLANSTTAVAEAAAKAAAAFKDLWEKQSRVTKAGAFDPNMIRVAKPTKTPPIIQRDASTGRITVNAEGELKGFVTALQPATEHMSGLALTAARVRVGFDNVLGTFKEGFSRIFTQFGPQALVMGALFDIFKGALEALKPVLDALREPLQIIGTLLGQVLGPVIKNVLVPPLKILAIVVTGIIQAIGWLIEAIGKAIDKIPGISAKGLIEFGQNMQDQAEAARRAIRAQDEATESLNKLTDSIIGAVAGFKVAQYRFGATAPGAQATIPTMPGRPGERTKPQVASVSLGTINIQTSGDGEETYRNFYDTLDQRTRGDSTGRTLFHAFPAPA